MAIIGFLVLFLTGGGGKLIISDFRLTVSDNPKPGLFLHKQNESMNRSRVVEFDLKNISHFYTLETNNRYRIVDYSDERLNMHHNREHHKYLIAKSIFEADLIINLPKPKTHRFAGITGAQKNFIGMCSDKEYLPHYRVGTPDKGGDETQEFNLLQKLFAFINYKRWVTKSMRRYYSQIFYYQIFRVINKIKTMFNIKYFFEGRWYGNDTIWRTILDLNLILLYGNSMGNISVNAVPRNVLTIGDMIISGENAGPLQPSPKPLGVILASNNLAAFDFIFCKITGFNYELIPTIKNSISNEYLLSDPFYDLIIKSNIGEYNNSKIKDIKFPSEWKFIPNPSWSDILR
jgi:hypothetical protein